jgi:hemerythrin-like domain-containing protein
VTAGSNLKADHRVIWRLESALRIMAARIVRGDRLPPEDVEEAVRLLTEFVDSYHHAKEEAGLFPVIEGKAREQQKTVYGFLVEHEFGRRTARRIEYERIRWMKAEGTAEALSRFMLTYADFIRVHTSKEDRWFKAVDQELLTEVQQKEVLARFAQVRSSSSRERLVQRVNGLAKKYSP